MSPDPFFARAVVLLALATPAVAQWPTDPSTNVAIADRRADQIVPLVATSPDGSTYVSWFDGASGNLDVYMQRLDPSGVEVWPHDGILVSDKPQNSAIFGGWGLIADSSGNAVLTFADERAGGDLDVQAYRISPTGAMLWGPDGITLSNDADFEPGSRVVETSDGDFVIAWQRDPSAGSGDLRIQRLAPDGTLRLAPGGLPVVTVAGEQPGFVDLVAADAGSVVLSWVRDITTFSSPRHLRALKLDAAGTPAWPAPVVVYDAFALPIGYAPRIHPDAAGGAILVWHRSDGTAYSSFVQHLDAAGTELFPHGGLEVSTTAGMFHIDPALARDPASGDLFVFWNERNLAQSAWGIFGQRISPAGARLWGAGGIQLLPVDATYKNFPHVVPAFDGAVVVLTRSSGAADELIAMRVDAAGATPWGASPVLVSSFPSAKARYPLTVDAAGVTRVVWEDDRNGDRDIYGQAIRPDGTLGAIIAATCLFRANVTSLLPHVPARSAIYQPPTSEGVSLQGSPLACPFTTGSLEPDAGTLDNGVPLQVYQVDLAAATLHLAKQGRTIRFVF